MRETVKVSNGQAPDRPDTNPCSCTSSFGLTLGVELIGTADGVVVEEITSASCRPQASVEAIAVALMRRKMVFVTGARKL